MTSPTDGSPHLSAPGEQHQPPKGAARGDYISRKHSRAFDDKRVIADYIAEHCVNDFDAVLLDAGSTAELIAESLFKKCSYLSVLTNNLGAHQAYTRAIRGSREGEDEPLSTGNELLLPSGRFVTTYEALLGENTVQAMRAFTPNVTIIAVSGVRTDSGVFCHGAEEVAVKEVLWNTRADRRILAADWRRIGRRDAHPFGPLDRPGEMVQRTTVVTTMPPHDEPDRKRYDDQIKAMLKMGLTVERLKVPGRNDGSTT